MARAPKARECIAELGRRTAGAGGARAMTNLLLRFQLAVAEGDAPGAVDALTSLLGDPSCEVTTASLAFQDLVSNLRGSLDAGQVSALVEAAEGRFQGDVGLVTRLAAVLLGGSTPPWMERIAAEILSGEALGRLVEPSSPEEAAARDEAARAVWGRGCAHFHARRFSAAHRLFAGAHAFAASDADRARAARMMAVASVSGGRAQQALECLRLAVEAGAGDARTHFVAFRVHLLARDEPACLSDARALAACADCTDAQLQCCASEAAGAGHHGARCLVARALVFRTIASLDSLECPSLVLWAADHALRGLQAVHGAHTAAFYAEASTLLSGAAAALRARVEGVHGKPLLSWKDLVQGLGSATYAVGAHALRDGAGAGAGDGDRAVAGGVDKGVTKLAVVLLARSAEVFGLLSGDDPAPRLSRLRSLAAAAAAALAMHEEWPREGHLHVAAARFAEAAQVAAGLFPPVGPVEPGPLAEAQARFVLLEAQLLCHAPPGGSPGDPGGTAALGRCLGTLQGLSRGDAAALPEQAAEWIVSYLLRFSDESAAVPEPAVALLSVAARRAQAAGDVEGLARALCLMVAAAQRTEALVPRVTREVHGWVAGMHGAAPSGGGPLASLPEPGRRRARRDAEWLLSQCHNLAQVQAEGDPGAARDTLELANKLRSLLGRPRETAGEPRPAAGTPGGDPGLPEADGGGGGGDAAMTARERRAAGSPAGGVGDLEVSERVGGDGSEDPVPEPGARGQPGATSSPPASTLRCAARAAPPDDVENLEVTMSGDE